MTMSYRASRTDQTGLANRARFAGIQAIVEAPAGHDELLGLIFQKMRTATGMPPIVAAARLGISEAALRAMEQGAVLAFPDWPQTVRIVTEYAQLSGIDASTVLRRIEAHNLSRAELVGRPDPGTQSEQTVEQTAAGQQVIPIRPLQTSAARAAPSSALKTAEKSARRKHRNKRAARRALGFVSVPMILAASVWYVIHDPGRVNAALGRLPEPLTHVARAGVEFVLMNAAATHEGLRQIETVDPRSRKTDKLPVRARAAAVSQ